MFLVLLSTLNFFMCFFLILNEVSLHQALSFEISKYPKTAFNENVHRKVHKITCISLSIIKKEIFFCLITMAMKIYHTSENFAPDLQNFPDCNLR